MIDVTTLNPAAPPEQYTAFVLMPGCLICGSQGMHLVIGGRVRCSGCWRWVESVEFAPTVLARRPAATRSGVR